MYILFLFCFHTLANNAVMLATAIDYHGRSY